MDSWHVKGKLDTVTYIQINTTLSRMDILSIDSSE